MKKIPKDLPRIIENNIYYVMGAIDFCHYDRKNPLVERKAKGPDTQDLYKLLLRYAKEELSLDVVSHTYEIDNGDTLGLYDGSSEEIELSKAPKSSKIITLVHEISHALIGDEKFSESTEEGIVETCAYVVLITLGLKIGDMSYPRGYEVDSKLLKKHMDTIKIISEQILYWVFKN
jgi:hypothetical protein